LVVGGVGLAAGVAFWLAGAPRAAKANANAKISLTPMAGAHEQGLLFEGRF
jgi:hypothetical protein